MYGPQNLTSGFAVPPLIRFVGGEEPYIATGQVLLLTRISCYPCRGVSICASQWCCKTSAGQQHWAAAAEDAHLLH